MTFLATPPLLNKAGAGINKWPTQATARVFYGRPGTGLTKVKPPFRIYYDEREIDAISIHARCSESLERVLQTVWQTCGHDQAEVNRLGISNYSGSFNYRPIRGAPVLSMHAYGAAVDFDAADNPMTRNPVAGKFTAEHPLVKAFEAEQWVWGGRWHGRRDPMHFQAARTN